MLGAYMRSVWEKSGSHLCANCGRAVIPDSGYWIHASFGKVDGANGLFCSPEMWADATIRVYATPAPKDIQNGN